MWEKPLGQLSRELRSALSNTFVNALGKGWRKERWVGVEGKKRQ